MKISLDALQILDAIERHGSFTAAAAALHRVPSAISHAVGRLEDDLGLKIFARSGRSAQLTAAGRTLLEDGRHLLYAISQLERRVQRVATGWEAELRIALDIILPASSLLPLVARFYAAGCGTRIHLAYEVLGGGWDALATDRADLVIGASGEQPALSGISSRLFATTELVFTVAPNHPLAAFPEPIPGAELQRHRAVVIADTSRELARRSSGLLEGREILRVPDMATKAAAQAAGLGVGHLPRCLAEQEAAAGRLVIRRLAEAPPPSPLYIAWRSRQEGKALAWFLEALEESEVKEALTSGLSTPLFS